MKTTIHFIRHAAYENPQRLVPGRIPSYHLSDTGREKAKRVGDFFTGRPIKFIYTSPLERAYETANVVSEFLPEAKIAHAYDLIEIDATNWQAYKLEELFTNNYYEAFLNDPNTNEVPENLNKLAARMRNFTLTLCKNHRGEEIICVSHEFPIITLKLSLENKPLKLLRTLDVAMGSVTTLVFDENCNFVETSYKDF